MWIGITVYPLFSPGFEFTRRDGKWKVTRGFRQIASILDWTDRLEFLFVPREKNYGRG